MTPRQKLLKDLAARAIAGHPPVTTAQGEAVTVFVVRLVQAWAGHAYCRPADTGELPGLRAAARALNRAKCRPPMDAAQFDRAFSRALKICNRLLSGEPALVGPDVIRWPLPEVTK